MGDYINLGLGIIAFLWCSYFTYYAYLRFARKNSIKLTIKEEGGSTEQHVFPWWTTEIIVEFEGGETSDQRPSTNESSDQEVK